MHRFLRLAVLSASLSSVAWAQDDDLDDFDFEDAGGEEADEPEEEADEPEVDRNDQVDTEDSSDPDAEENWLDSEEQSTQKEEFKLDDEFDTDSKVEIQGAGEDTARIYREFLDNMEDLGPDEEALSWEKYLKKYPNSLFKSRIEERLQVLEEKMYAVRLDGDGRGTVDAGKAELNFARPVLLESIDPYDKLRLGFAIGLPNYVAGAVDFERQIQRNLSVHGGYQRRYIGRNFETGVKYAIIKSARTNTVLTGIGDLHLNIDPAFVGFRPVVGVGQRFDYLLGLDLQAQLGGDFLFTGGVSPRLVGGANATLRASKTVLVYIETSSTMKDMFYEYDHDAQGRVFRFNVLTFGLKFVARKGATTELLELGLAAHAPYTTNYWSYHQGSVMPDLNLFYGNFR